MPHTTAKKPISGIPVDADPTESATETIYFSRGSVDPRAAMMFGLRHQGNPHPASVERAGAVKGVLSLRGIADP
jgi:hypothetical protein